MFACKPCFLKYECTIQPDYADKSKQKNKPKFTGNRKTIFLFLVVEKNGAKGAKR
ncbi:hypothetical protein M472_14260 [Sphingobacterium paucimobilis HER1398]|uniref:Uncharacterized protein n=1 Tax=Sphingobacterium paucimobilis HER1398 TaxID=1346330 RepID=U2J4Q3_9SPHI|nr:hypothetical protein M472_14260 [Sphingobacterium paucimobilis HER1398]